MNRSARVFVNHLSFLLAVLIVPTLGRGQCSPRDQGAFMASWSGQPGKNDRSDKKPVNQGTRLLCIAYAAGKSVVPPACHLSYGNNVVYTLSSHQEMSVQKDGLVTLTCNGQ